MSPTDFDLFSKLKETLHRTHFGSLDELLLAKTREIHHLNKKQLLKGKAATHMRHLVNIWQMTSNV